MNTLNDDSTNNTNQHQPQSWDQIYTFPRLLHPYSLEPFVLQPSLFHDNNVPPTIYFNTKLNEESKPPLELPKKLQQMFKWKISSITPNTIRSCISFMRFEVVRPSNQDDTSYLGSWCKHMPTADFSGLEEWRKVNHYPGSFHMGRKDKLWSRLKLAGDKFDSFHPRTFILPKDYEELDKYWKECPDKLFIMKPPASARGNGIRVINKISQVPSSAFQPSIDGSIKKSTIVVQEYISKPCLLENGLKFDLRIYVLLTSVDPLRVYVYDEGLVRFASSKYTSQQDGIIDQFMHLTNYFVNKNNQGHQTDYDCESLHSCKWSLKRFWRYLNEHHKHVDTKRLWEEIIDIIIKTCISCEGPMYRLSHQFCKNDYTSYELFGFDIILDEDFKPWILEVNITPSLKSESSLDTSVKYRVIKDMFNLVGYHLPPPNQTMRLKLGHLADQKSFFDSRLYQESLSKRDRIKHLKYQKLFKQRIEESTSRRASISDESLLSDLSQSDARVLMLAEDELSRCGQFARVFPSANSSKYMKYFDKPRYYNLLLDAWEQKYKDNRLEGVRRLSNLAKFLEP